MAELQRQERHLQPVVLPSLEELAQIANREHEACEAILAPALRGALSHAIPAGEALIQARALVETGKWRQWLRDNFNGSYAAANRYFRIATYQHLIQDSNSVKDALEALAGMPDAASRSGAPRLYSDGLREQALEDLATGATLEEVAATYHVSLSTVYRWRSPNKAAEHRRRWYARRRAATLALARQEKEREIAKAVRKAGAAHAEAYSMAARMQDVLAQALAEAKTNEVRTALTEAIRTHNQTRDEIVRALGVAP